MCIARYADVLGLLGRLCLAQGDYEGGEEYLMKGLAAYEKYTHSNHPAVGVITQGLVIPTPFTPASKMATHTFDKIELKSWFPVRGFDAVLY